MMFKINYLAPLTAVFATTMLIFQKFLGRPSSLKDLSFEEFCTQYPNSCEDQEDALLIEWVKWNILSPPQNPKGPLNFTNKPVYKGQLGVPPIIDGILKQKRGGFFVEVGAHDGEFLTNTILFEEEREWSGLLIEPSKIAFQRLMTKNRKVMAANCCLSPSKKPEYIEFTGDGETLGGFKELVGGETSARILCVPLYTLIVAMDNPTIDYWSLDVEKAEYKILRNVPFEKMTIRTMSVEYHNLPEKEREEMVDLVKKNGFQIHSAIKYIDYIIVHNSVLFK